MRAQHTLRSTAIAVGLACTVAGCSALPGASGKGEKEKPTASGPTYQQALETLRPDAVGALKAVMPKAEQDENESADDCGGLDILDSKDGSKRRASLTATATGDPSDGRDSRQLVESAVRYLTGRGWVVEKRADTTPAGEPDGYTQYVKKSGTPGKISITAAPFKLTSGKTIQNLSASAVTNCLRNPDWHTN